MAGQSGAFPPDGGWGWMVVAASSISACLMVGATNIVYSVHYIHMTEVFNTTAAAVGVIMTVFMLFCNVPFLLHTLLMEKFGMRPVAMVGSFFGSAAFVVSCFSTNLMMMTVTMGALGGVFLGAYWYVVFVAPQKYFDKKRGLAGGIVTIGASLGFVLFGPIVQLLTERYGWRGARLICSGLMMNTIPLSMCYRPVPTKKMDSDAKQNEVAAEAVPANSSSHIDSHEERNSREGQQIEDKTIGTICWNLLPGSIAIVAMVLCFTALMILYSHMVNRSVSIGLTAEQAALVMSVYGLSSLLGRIIFTLSTRLPCTSILVLCTVGSLLTAVCIGVTGFTYGLWETMMATAATGISIGGYMSVQVTALRDLVGLQYFPRMMAVLFAASGAFGTLAVPLAGWIFDLTGNYNLSFIAVGCIVFVGSLVLGFSVVLHHILHRNDLPAGKEQETEDQL